LAIALDGTNSHAWSGKGFALMKLGRLPAAVEALETAVRLDPELSNAWINLGEAQMRNHNLGRAIQALEKAMTLAPAAMDARWFLAQSYLNVRLPAKSREQAEKLLENCPLGSRC
jgi:tetratricopeptide (TPR) repeat protein